MQVIIGTKIGMTQIIGEDGIVTPVTILQADPATVTQIKTVETDGYNAVQLGYGQGKNLRSRLLATSKRPESRQKFCVSFALVKLQSSKLATKSA